MHTKPGVRGVCGLRLVLDDLWPCFCLMTSVVSSLRSHTQHPRVWLRWTIPRTNFLSESNQWRSLYNSRSCAAWHF